MDHFERDTVRVDEVDGPATLVGPNRWAHRFGFELHTGGHEAAIGSPQVVDGETNMDVADVRRRAARGRAFRLDVLDQIQMEAGDVEAGNLQARARDTDQARHVVGGYFAALVGDVEAKQVAVKGDRPRQVADGHADVVRR